MSIKAFFKNACSFLFNVKHLLLIIVLIGIPIGIYFTYDYISTKNKKEREKEKQERIELSNVKTKDSLSKVKKWDTIDRSVIGANQLELKTKYIDGYINILLNCDSVDKNKFPLLRDNDDVITIIFVDSDDFEIHKIRIPVSSLTRIMDDNNLVIGFTYQGKDPMSIEKYKSIMYWKLGWSFD